MITVRTVALSGGASAIPPDTNTRARASSIVVQRPTIGVPSLVSLPRAAMSKARARYKEHRWNAFKRPVPFEISFADWIAIWWYSGHGRPR